MTDAIQSAIQFAMNGLQDRQKATTNNISNIMTPGYLANTSDFESSLKAALNGNGASGLKETFSKSLAATNQDGNNVDLDQETVNATDTELKYQAMVEAMNTKFKLLRSAMGS